MARTAKAVDLTAMSRSHRALRPDGRVIYLRPTPEHDYLASLAEAGLFQYLIVD